MDLRAFGPRVDIMAVETLMGDNMGATDAGVGSNIAGPGADIGATTGADTWVCMLKKSNVAGTGAKTGAGMGFVEMGAVFPLEVPTFLAGADRPWANSEVVSFPWAGLVHPLDDGETGIGSVSFSVETCDADFFACFSVPCDFFSRPVFSFLALLFRTSGDVLCANGFMTGGLFEGMQFSTKMYFSRIG